MDAAPAATRAPGRPPATTSRDIFRTVLALSIERGFAAITLDDLADALGVSRSTILRYFRTKNDIVFYRFDERVEAFRSTLRDTPGDLPVLDSVAHAMQARHLEQKDDPEFQQSMMLIMTEPTLQAQRAHRVAQIQDVFAEHVADRLQVDRHEFVPHAVAHIATGLIVMAAERWARYGDDPAASIARAFALIRSSASGDSALLRL
jgi:AcrR family transcriptional regulator